MAQAAEVSIPIIREALAQLRGEGLIRIRHGVGVFVASRPRRARLIRAARRRAARRDVAELRASVEPLAAAAAAARVTDSRVLELRLLLGERELARRTGNARQFAEADMDLHRAVLRMSGNQLAATSVELAGPMLLRDAAAAASVLATDDRLQQLHGLLVDAIEMHRPTLARRAALSIVAREDPNTRGPP
jgi:DNA-binding FadR family transcriptional regulator